MLGKLIKYEFKSLLRIFLPLYCAMIVLSVIMPINNEFNDIGAFVIFALVIISTSIFIGLAIFTILRFNSALFGDEGYLMFTLPVSVETIVFSKALTMLFYYALAGFSGFISLLIMLARAGVLKVIFMGHYIEEFLEVFNANTVLLLLNLLVFCILSVLSFVLTVYASISVGQVIKYKKIKYLVAFAFYFIISYIFARLMLFANAPFSLFSPYMNYAQDYSININISLLLYNIASLIKVAIMFVLTTYLLKNKLNLD